MKRFALWFLALLLTILLVVPLSLYLTVRSEAGSRVLLNWALSMSPVNLTFSSAQGNLLNGMIFSNFALELGTTQVEADSLDIAWQPQKLWMGSLSLEHVDVQNLIVNIESQSSDGEAGWPEVHLPLELFLGRLRIEGFRLNGTEVFQQLEFSGSLAGSELEIETLELQRQTEQLVLSGDVGLDGSYPMSLHLDWQYQLQQQNWSGAAELSGDLETLEISHQLLTPYQIQSELSLSQSLPSSPGDLALERISFAGEHRSAQLDLRDMLGDSGLITDLRVETSGDLDAIDWSMQGQLTLPWAGASQVAGQGNYQPGLVTVQSLEVETEKGNLAANGRYDFAAETIRMDAIRLTDVQLAEDINGLEAEIQMQVNLADGLDMQATLEQASLEQGPILISADGSFQYRDNQLTTTGLNLSSGVNQAGVSGQLYPQTNIRWQLDGPQLGEVIQALADMESAQIALSGSGSVSGEITNPRVEAELEGSDIELLGLALDSFHLRVTQNANQHHVVVEVPALDYSGRSLSDLELDADIEAQAFDARASLVLGSMNIDAQANGLKQEYWRLALTQFDLTAPQPIGDWSMQQELTLVQEATGWLADQACWVSELDAGLCLEASLQEGTLSGIDLELTDLPLGFVDYLVVSPLRFDGLLNGSLHAEGVGPGLQLQAEFQSENGSFLVLGQEQTPDPVAYRQLTLTAAMQDQLLTANAGVQLGDSGRISAQGQLNLASEQPEVDAMLTLDMEKLQWLDGVVTQIDSVSGNLELNLNLSGSLQNPSLSLSGQLRDGGLIVPRAGIELSSLTLIAEADGDNRIEVRASAMSGDGQIDMEGFVDAEELAQLTAEFDIVGENFQLLDRSDMRLVINPDLVVQFSPELLDISGDLDIQQARARIRALPEGGVRPSEDEVIVGESDTQGRRLQTSLDLRIELGSEVEFEGFGLATGLTGELDIEQSPGEAQRSFGTIELIDGEYSAYGRTLTVRRGRMIFQGEFDNPALDVDAEQSYPDYLVGIHLGGTAQEPTTTLFSTPVMSQSDVLAVLLTGQKLDTMSASEAPTLLDAATRLGIVGGASIAERIEDSFGLSEFGVRNDNQNGQSLVAGTYVFPRLYVEWAQGLFEASSAVQLEYRISDQLRLKARSGTSQSMDLIYEIETD